MSRLRVEDISDDDKSAIAENYASFARCPIITPAGATFLSPSQSSDISTVKFHYSQRDLHANSFKQWSSSRSLQRPVVPSTSNQSSQQESLASSAYLQSQPAFETSATTTILSPSRRYTLSLRSSSPEGSTNKQTLLEVFLTETMQPVASTFLDGKVLLGTPFSAPQFSPDEAHILFSFLHNDGVKQIESALANLQEDEKPEQTSENKEEKSTKRATPAVKLTVEQSFAKLFTNTARYSQQDCGEQLSGIDFPFLLVFSLENQHVQTVHPPTIQSVLMPTLAYWAPALKLDTADDKSSPIVPSSSSSPKSSKADSLAIYPIIFVANVLFPFRLGQIFYSTRASRLYLSVIHLSTVQSKTDLSSIPCFEFGQQAAVQKKPAAAPKTYFSSSVPLLYCLTPDAHCIHAPAIYTPLLDPKTTSSDDDVSPFVPSISTNPADDYVDITYLEGLSYDQRWGPSPSLLDQLRHKQSPATSLTTVEECNTYLESIHFQQQPAQMLLPHNTTLALRVLRLSIDHYRSIVRVLSTLAICAHVLDATVPHIISRSVGLPNDAQVNSVTSSPTQEKAVSEVFAVRPDIAALIDQQSFNTVLSQHGNLPEPSDNDPFGPVELLTRLFASFYSSLPSWPYESGAFDYSFILNHSIITQPSWLRSTTQQTAQYEQLFGAQTWKQFLSPYPTPQSLLPLNMQSYGVYIAGNHHIKRLSRSSLIFNNSLRDIHIVSVVQYTAITSGTDNDAQSTPFGLPSDAESLQVRLGAEGANPTAPQFAVQLSVLAPPDCRDENLFLETQFPHKLSSNDSQTPINPPALLNVDQEWRQVIPHVKFPLQDDLPNPFALPSTLPAQRVPAHQTSPVPDLPISTRFNSVETNITAQDVRWNRTPTSVVLCDSRGPFVLLYLTATTQFPELVVAELPSELFDAPDASKCTLRAIPSLVADDVWFHSDNASLRVAAAKPSVDYTPRVVLLPQTISVVQGNPPTAIASLQHLVTISVNSNAYNDFSECQSLVTFDRRLFNLNPEFITAMRGHDGDFAHDLLTTISGKTVGNVAPRGVILFPHGGPHGHFSNMYEFVVSQFAARGYLVIRTNYGGSTGYGEVPLRSLMGYIGYMDASDCLRSLDCICAMFHLHSNTRNNRAATQPQNDCFQQLPIHFFGGSHSGFLGSFVTVYRNFASCIVRNAVLSMFTTASTSDIADWGYSTLGFMFQPTTFFWSPPQLEADRISQSSLSLIEDDANPSKPIAVPPKAPNQPWTLSRALEVQSPMNYIHFVQTPTLLAVGLSDRRVPHLQSTTYHRLLSQRNVPCVISIYANAQHHLNDTPHIHAHSITSSLQFMERFSLANRTKD